MNVEFVKMHGLGNDFVLIDDRAGELDFAPEAVAWVCDRNFGIGADGLMLVRNTSAPEADYAWWFRNADGSVAEMCGNGIRCFAKYLADHGLIDAERNSVAVETAVGVKTMEVIRDPKTGRVLEVTVDMGMPVLASADISTALSAGGGAQAVLDRPLVTGEGIYRVSAVSMGNPHCVLWVDDAYDCAVETIGPLIENHPAFPQKTNVEFAQLVSDTEVLLRVWERGVGETLACGTGACATAVAGVLSGRLKRQSAIQLPGGGLVIHIAENGGCDDSGYALGSNNDPGQRFVAQGQALGRDPGQGLGRVFMTGSATEVFKGSLEIG
ncbi:MAG: diaminopimelate epimerase [Coriobacteriia bacterium]|nr:diaminopimelate epimerase [Coriobacteriia bacterium]